MTANSAIPHLSPADLDGFGITTEEVVKFLSRLILDAADNTAWHAPKAVLTPPDGRYIMSTLAAMSDPPLVATKSLVLNDRNREAGLPPINSLVSLIHGETGLPLATIDGNWITAVRTAGLSAVAAGYLARKDTQTIGFVGTGVQARSHLDAMGDLFPLKHILISGRGQTNIDLLSEAAEARGLTSEICDTPQDAVRNADIVVTSVTHTAVSEPFLDANHLRPGACAIMADLGAPWHRKSFGSLDLLAVDDLEQEASLPKPLADPRDVNGDLHGLVSGKLAGRLSDDQRTAFLFRGLAIGDLALAALAWQKYQDR
ncbi:ornithine cyclodeaminase family protein [Amaricoccus tamworthensis]|uniref:ornithine cyclodeaminase family protein n=1 Tax=Amaricoccus tamworthensis TaxID=57002 RepID=UPI003C7B87D1